MTFYNPISGEWKIEIRNLGVTETSTFKISSNYPFHVEYISETEELDNKEKVDLQVGPNSGDSFTMNLTDATIQGLGLDAISIMTPKDAIKALQTVDTAMREMSTERSRFGAYQNRLEHIYRNICNSEENLQAAESRVRDVDMAKEMVKITKRNILQQASTAMLAQANQVPQSVMKLLV